MLHQLILKNVNNKSKERTDFDPSYQPNFLKVPNQAQMQLPNERNWMRARRGAEHPFGPGTATTNTGTSWQTNN